MTSATPLITGTDFITVATRDFEAATDFYGGILGLRLSSGGVRGQQASSRRGT
jgi:catechol 2,3-dioxygenase-like lactoylglutathione lyase family enzyme